MSDERPSDDLQRRLKELLPRASAWDVPWVEANSLGENVLHLTESLTQVMPLRPGMRVLDLGCGHAVSSIFLAREFGVQVWAVDRGVDPSDNLARIVEHGCEGSVFPVRADARALPFPHGFFDAIVSFDSYLYYGTDDRYLSLLAPLLRGEGSASWTRASTRDPRSNSPRGSPRGRTTTGTCSTASRGGAALAKTRLMNVERVELVPASRLIMDVTSSATATIRTKPVRRLRAERLRSPRRDLPHARYAHGRPCPPRSRRRRRPHVPNSVRYEGMASDLSPATPSRQRLAGRGLRWMHGCGRPAPRARHA